jgi:phospholipase/lecithinase/hemolysin
MSIGETTARTAATLALGGWVLAALAGAGLSQSSPSELFVFGDSLSDPGNAYALTGLTSKAPFAPVPSAPYAMGGHHFSNGKTWAERLAQDLGLDTGGKPALAASGNFGNYAIGGSRARTNSSNPSCAMQIGLFQFARGGVVPPDGLYVIAFGGNDVRDAMAAAATSPSSGYTIITDAVASMDANVRGLYDDGARRFLVANAPNLGKTPAVIGAGAASAGEFFSALYRDMLKDCLDAIEADPNYPGIRIDRLDMYQFIDDIVANPAAFGIADPFAPCLSFYTKSGAKCEDADEHLFWDAIHPTAKGHTKLAEAAAAALGGTSTGGAGF